MKHIIIRTTGLSLLLLTTLASAAQCPPLSINGGDPGGVDYTVNVYSDFYEIAAMPPHKAIETDGISSSIRGKHCSYTLQHELPFTEKYVDYSDAVTGKTQTLLQNPPMSSDSAYANIDLSKTQTAHCYWQPSKRFNYRCDISFYVK